MSYQEKIQEWKQRLGCFKDLPLGRYIWVHCASVGEVRISSALIKELKQNFPEHKILLSVITPAGYKIANQEKLPVERVFFLPLDIPFVMGRVVRKILPELLVLIETELWPGLIKHAKKNGAKISLVNGRISDKSFKYYRFFRPFTKMALKKIDMFLMREKIDEEHIIELGAGLEKVHITGNIKYDQILDKKNLETIKEQVSRKGFLFDDKDVIFTAGSIREGEEKLVIDVCEVLRNRFPGIKFILAPRHVEQFEKVGRLLRRRNLPHLFRSRMSSLITPDISFTYLVLDTFGELMKAYAISDLVFVGGSLLPSLGGQNMIEPASLGKAVVFGRYTKNFAEPARILKDSGGALEVKDSYDLAENLIYLLKDRKLIEDMGRKAKTAVFAMVGATERNIEGLKELIPEKQNSILIVQPSRIGDVIFSLPVLVNLRNLYPKSRICWLVDDRCKELLDGNPYIDKIIVFPFKQLKLSSPGKLIEEIKHIKRIFQKENFDMSIDLHGLAKSAVMVLFAGAKRRIASASTYGMKELSWMFSKELKPKKEGLHTIDRHLEVIKFLGGPGYQIKKEFPVVTSEKDKQRVDEVIRETGINRSKKIVAVMAGGGWLSRRWFPWRYAELCDKMIQNMDVEICFIGGKPGGSSEEGVIESVLSLMKKKAYNLSGKFTLKQLAEFFKLTSLYLGNETGPMHLACALGLPVVAIIGPTDPTRTGPFGDNFTVVRRQQACAPCKERNCQDVKCMESILVEDVYKTVENMLK